jgi:Icc-related predicted phosphoesterase
MQHLVLISDTHRKHKEITEHLIKIHDEYNDAILIHAGDISSRGEDWEIKSFLDWYRDLPFKHKIFIAGNHDFLFEVDPIKANGLLYTHGEGITYLQDTGIEIDNIKFWGSPMTPRFHDWAFNRDENIQDHWDMIPEDTNVLITHGPAYSILDSTRFGLKVGCPRLLNKISDLKDLRAHICGHIHEANGIYRKDEKTFINASTLNLYYDVEFYPVILEI